MKSAAVCAIFLVISCAYAAPGNSAEQNVQMTLEQAFEQADQLKEVAEEESGTNIYTLVFLQWSVTDSHNYIVYQ